MRVYRLCSENEAESVIKDRGFEGIGHKCQIDLKKNNHSYKKEENYMHFFENEISLLYLYPSKGKRICVYDIPEDILNSAIGTGFYLDFIELKCLEQVTEYAVESRKMKFEYLERIYAVQKDLDFDYVPNLDQLYASLSLIYDANLSKEKLEQILRSKNVIEEIEANQEYILKLVPEIKAMIGFQHRHPHHHLDVWQHTMEVLKRLDTKDLELRMAALLHDIGKPFSYQDDEVRHFHGHPEVSYQMTKQILTRLGYDKKYIEKVAYLVRTHDTPIEVDNLDNTLEMIQKRLQLQYADAKAHHPDKIDKRIKFLDNITRQLQMMQREEER